MICNALDREIDIPHQHLSLKLDLRVFDISREDVANGVIQPSKLLPLRRDHTYGAARDGQSATRHRRLSRQSSHRPRTNDVLLNDRCDMLARASSFRSETAPCRQKNTLALLAPFSHYTIYFQ